ncbi:Uncharacterized protein FKW44_016808 [Caligus rogercresseyi]|uniref:Uncharacterized protein n=1 Tax=Caligus rogercresseyi TaxID=217165 RepID=A0A7T8H2G0_CALRO|nr:Uncharacterized protein FKW44_016808 [Caligus rogercresseyi]
MSMKEIIEVTSDIESSRQFLQIRGCLRFYPPTCTACHRPMSLSKFRGGAKRWNCGTHQDKLLTRGVVPYGQIPVSHFPTRSAWLGRGPKKCQSKPFPRCWT